MRDSARPAGRVPGQLEGGNMAKKAQGPVTAEQARAILQDAAVVKTLAPAVVTALVGIAFQNTAADAAAVNVATVIGTVTPPAIDRSPVRFPYSTSIVTAPAKKVGSAFSTARIDRLSEGVVARSGLSVRCPTG